MKINHAKMQLAISLLLLTGISFLLASTAGARERTEAVDNQIVVRLESGQLLDDINATYGTITVQALGTADMYLLQVPTGEDTNDIIELMEDDNRILLAEPNYIGDTPEADPSSIWGWGGQNSQPYGEQYAIDALNLNEAQTMSTGSGIVIAVLDTGIELDHPALQGSITAVRADFVDGDNSPDDEFNGLDDDGDGLIDEAAGHGTHVAGIVHLVAPSAQIMPVRVLDSDGRGEAYALAEAIQFAADNGANVINLSLGMGTKSNSLKDIIRQVTQQGVLVVSAAGNLGQDEKQYPGANSCSLVVTAVGQSLKRSNFANYGSWITLAAPGESIYSPFPDGYAWWDGTSMATPFVSGQAALLMSLSPTLNPRQINSLIVGTTKNLDPQNPRFKGKLGAGLLDVEASLTMLQSGQLPGNSGSYVMSGGCVSD